MGLSLSYGIMRQLGGSIEIRSEVGKGTDVTLTLPR
ncbi:MAG TPA: ATP-binding protein [Planctomycetota bacterium]